MPHQPLAKRPAMLERRDKNPRDEDIYLNPNIPPNTPVMRAPTMKERVGDKIRDAYESVAEQPLAKIADLLGLTDFAGIKESFTTPDDGVRMGALPGPPGGKAFGTGRNFYQSLANKNRYLAAEENRILAGQHKNRVAQMDREIASGAPSIPFEQITESPRMLRTYQDKLAASPKVQKMQPSTVPNEFHMANEVEELIKGLGGPQGSVQILDDASRPLLNASGESMASAEAMSRMRGMKSAGKKYVVRKGGTTRELIGPEAVDYNPRPGEQYGILDADGLFQLLQGR